MSFVESMEARRLCATTPTPTPDATFGKNGTIAFSIDNSVTDVLATGGEIYVQAYQRARNRIAIFKYDDNGVPDTTWGRGGYIVPTLLADQAKTRILTLAMSRDPRTGGLLLGATNKPIGKDDEGVYDPTSGVVVQRYAANGRIDTAWGSSGQIAYGEPNTGMTLARVIVLPHKGVMLAMGRQQQQGKSADGKHLATGGAYDVAILKFNSRGRYDRTFNDGHALTVASGNYHSKYYSVDDYTDKIDEDYTEPTFGDIQFFSNGTLRVVSTREEAHQTRTTYNIDVITYKGTKVESAESTLVSASGAVRPKQSQSYVLKRLASEDDGLFAARATVADSDGQGISVLIESGDSTGKAGGALIRVGPGYRTRPDFLPAPFGTRYLGDARRTGNGTVLVGSGGTSDFSDDKPTLGIGPGVLSLGRDLAVGRNKAILPPTYFPEFSLDTYTTDDQGRLLVEGTNADTDTFDLVRYA